MSNDVFKKAPVIVSSGAMHSITVQDALRNDNRITRFTISAGTAVRVKISDKYDYFFDLRTEKECTFEWSDVVSKYPGYLSQCDLSEGPFNPNKDFVIGMEFDITRSGKPIMVQAHGELYHAYTIFVPITAILGHGTPKSKMSECTTIANWLQDYISTSVWTR